MSASTPRSSRSSPTARSATGAGAKRGRSNTRARQTESESRLDLDDVYRALRDRITLLELAPGTWLREQSLAAEFGISRTPIRRVLDRLAYEGLVTIHPGSGASVSIIDYRELREVWALRLKVCELVGEFVRVPVAPEITERLQASLAKLGDGSITDGRALALAYDEYHRVVLDIMDNGPLRRIYDQLYVQTARVYVQLLPGLDLAQEIDAMREEVALTLDASTDTSGHRLAEVRAKHMHMLLERLNQTLVMSTPSMTPPASSPSPKEPPS